MAAADPVTLIGPDDRAEGDLTPGMVREQAIAVDRMWAGLVRTGARMISGWHHHGDYDTAIYVLKGRFRLECGPNGSVVIDAGPGDFLHVPQGAIHWEGNPSDEEGQAIVLRAGQGPPVINVEGPAVAS